MIDEWDRLIKNSFSIYDDSHRPQRPLQPDEAVAASPLDKDQRDYFNKKAIEGYRLFNSFPKLRRLDICSAYISKKRNVYEQTKALQKEKQRRGVRRIALNFDKHFHSGSENCMQKDNPNKKNTALVSTTSADGHQNITKTIPFTPKLSDLPVAYLSENQIINNQAGDKKIDIYFPSGQLKIKVRGTQICEVEEESMLKDLVFVNDSIISFDDREFENVQLVKERENESIRKFTVVGRREKGQVPPLPPPPKQVVITEENTVESNENNLGQIAKPISDKKPNNRINKISTSENTRKVTTSDKGASVRKNSSEEALNNYLDTVSDSHSNVLNHESSNLIATNKHSNDGAIDEMSSLSSESKLLKKQNPLPTSNPIKRKTSLNSKLPKQSTRIDRVTKSKLPASKCDVIPLTKKYVGVARNAKKVTSSLKRVTSVKLQQKIKSQIEKDQSNQVELRANTLKDDTVQGTHDKDELLHPSLQENRNDNAIIQKNSLTIETKAKQATQSRFTFESLIPRKNSSNTASMRRADIWRETNDDMSSLSSESRVGTEKYNDIPAEAPIERSIPNGPKEGNNRSEKITKHKLPSSFCDAVPLSKQYVGVARTAKATKQVTSTKRSHHDAFKPRRMDKNIGFANDGEHGNENEKKPHHTNSQSNSDGYNQSRNTPQLSSIYKRTSHNECFLAKASCVGFYGNHDEFFFKTIRLVFGISETAEYSYHYIHNALWAFDKTENGFSEYGVAYVSIPDLKRRIEFEEFARNQYMKHSDRRIKFSRPNDKHIFFLIPRFSILFNLIICNVPAFKDKDPQIVSKWSALIYAMNFDHFCFLSSLASNTQISFHNLSKETNMMYDFEQERLNKLKASRR